MYGRPGPRVSHGNGSGTGVPQGSRGGPGVLLLLRVSPQHPTPLARLLPLPRMDWVILGA